MIPNFPDFIFIDDSTLNYTSLENVLRSQMEVGPPKTRPMACKPMFQIAFTARICGLEDFNRFKFWFKNEISYGAYGFLLIDPFDGVEKKFKFATTQFSWSKLDEIYSATFSLEAIDA